MEAIIKFTSSLGEVNYGIVIGSDIGGMLEICWDTFAALLTRLEARGRVSDFVRAGLSVRTSWVRVETPLPNGATLELLPITMPVQWHEASLATLQRSTLQKVAVIA